MTILLPATHALPGPWAASAMIAAIVLCSTTGEVLTAAAMKSIGDLDEIRAHSGLMGAIRAVVSSPLFFAGLSFLALGFFSLLFALNHLNLSLVAPGIRFTDAGDECGCSKGLSARERGPATLDRGRAGVRGRVFSGALRA